MAPNSQNLQSEILVCRHKQRGNKSIPGRETQLQYESHTARENLGYEEHVKGEELAYFIT